MQNVSTTNCRMIFLPVITASKIYGLSAQCGCYILPCYGTGSFVNSGLCATWASHCFSSVKRLYFIFVRLQKSMVSFSIRLPLKCATSTHTVQFRIGKAASLKRRSARSAFRFCQSQQIIGSHSVKPRHLVSSAPRSRLHSSCFLHFTTIPRAWKPLLFQPDFLLSAIWDGQNTTRQTVTLRSPLYTVLFQIGQKILTSRQPCHPVF